MEGVGEFFVALMLGLDALFVIFLVRVWGFFSQHPLIKLLFGSEFVLHMREEYDDGTAEVRRVRFQLEHRKK